MSLLFITAGTKGGIGKTLTATLLADIALFKGLQVVMYDCDNENESLKNAYLHPAEDCRVETVKMNCDEADMDYPLDFVVNDILQTEEESKGKKYNVYIVDMKAGTTHYTLEWLEAFPFDMIRAQGIDIYIVGCVTADVDSVHTLARWITRFSKDLKEKKLRFLIVKNNIQGKKFNTYEEILGDSLETGSNSNVVIELPNLGFRYAKAIKESCTSFGQIAMERSNIKQFKYMDKHRIREVFKKVVKSLNTVWPPPVLKKSKS